MRTDHPASQVRLGPAGPRPPGSGLRAFAFRALLVALGATLAPIAVTRLWVGPFDLHVDALDITVVAAFPLLVAAAATAVRHRTRHWAWWSRPERRWVFAGVMTVAAVLTVVAMVLVGTVLTLLLVPSSRVADGPMTVSPVSGAVVAIVFVTLLTGLPAWTLLFGALVGPGEPPPAAR